MLTFGSVGALIYVMRVKSLTCHFIHFPPFTHVKPDPTVKSVVLRSVTVSTLCTLAVVAHSFLISHAYYRVCPCVFLLGLGSLANACYIETGFPHTKLPGVSRSERFPLARKIFRLMRFQMFLSKMMVLWEVKREVLFLDSSTSMGVEQCSFECVLWLSGSLSSPTCFLSASLTTGGSLSRSTAKPATV